MRNNRRWRSLWLVVMFAAGGCFSMQEDVVGPVGSAVNAVTEPIGQFIKPVTKPVGDAVKETDFTFGLLKKDEAEEEEEISLIAAVEASKIGFAPRWSASLGIEDESRAVHVALLGDVIVIVERPNNLMTAITARDGLIRWHVVAGSRLERLFEPVRIGDAILINTETHLMAYSVENGQMLYRTALESAVVDRPEVVEKLAIFGGLNGRVFAHNTVTGYPKWRRQMTGGIVVRPVVSGFNVLVTDSNGIYGLFNAMSGNELWKGRTFGRITTAPVLSDIGAFIPSEDQTLYALNRSTGSDRWKYRSAQPMRTTPKLLGNTLYLHEPDIGLLALDAISGDELWRVETEGQPLTVSRRRLLLHEPRQIVALEPATGKHILQVPTAELYEIIATEKGSLILVTEDGRVTRLDPAK